MWASPSRIQTGSHLLNIVIAVIACLVLAGCDSGSKTAMDLVAKRNVIVLASRDMSLNETPVELQSSKPMEVSGSLSSVCFVLKDGVPMQDVNAMDRAFAGAIGEAKISSALLLSNGARVPLSLPSISWSDEGVVLKRGELAACAAPRCDATLPIGAVVSRIEVSAVPAFTTKGIYWKSERDPSEPLLPPATAEPNAQSTTKKNCSVPQ